MLRHRETSLVILVVLSLFIQIDVDAHLQNTNINPKASVTIRHEGDVDILIARASCSFSIGAHAGGGNHHLHYANWFGQVYIHPIGGFPINEPGVYAVRHKTRAIWGSGSWAPDPIQVSKTLAPGQCAYGDAFSRGRLWTPNEDGTTLDEEYKQDPRPSHPSGKSHCNHAAAAPGIFRSRIQDEIQEQEIDLDDLRDTVRDAIQSARASNPDADTGIFLRGRIQTLVSDDNTLYVYESYALGNPELFLEHLNGNLRAGATVVGTRSIRRLRISTARSTAATQTV